MKSEWESVKLGDFCSKIGSGSTPRGGSSVYLEQGEYALFRSQNILHNTFTRNGLVFIDRQAADKLKNVSVAENDVLLNITGDSVARVCKVPSEYLPARVNQHVAIIRTNQEELDSSYVNYYLNSREMQNYMLSLASAGATRNALTKVMIENFEISKPPLPTQKKIAHILSTLDDKIECNRKMNETLETMAQALFKSWFVDFDPLHAKANAKSDTELEKAAAELGISKEVLELFPSTFVESEMGMIPEGWEVKPLKDFGQVITGKTPSTKKKENYGNKYPFITIPDMHNQVFVVNTARYLSEEGHFVQKNKLIPKNSLIVSCIATVGLVSINSEASHTNQQINSIVCLPRYLYYLYCMLNGMHDELIMYGSAGTATLNVNKNTFENINVIKPSDESLDTFFEMVSSLFDQILKNVQQIQTLQQTRDMLLPKLLSGELNVSEVKI